MKINNSQNFSSDKIKEKRKRKQKVKIQSSSFRNQQIWLVRIITLAQQIGIGFFFLFLSLSPDVHSDSFLDFVQQVSGILVGRLSIAWLPDFFVASLCLFVPYSFFFTLPSLDPPLFLHQFSPFCWSVFYIFSPLPPRLLYSFFESRLSLVLTRQNHQPVRLRIILQNGRRRSIHKFIRPATRCFSQFLSPNRGSFFCLSLPLFDSPIFFLYFIFGSDQLLNEIFGRVSSF